MKAPCQTIGKTFLNTQFSARKRTAHKGDFGHVLVIGGDYGMGGAVRLAAEAALHVGSGLVSVATRAEHITLVSASRPEIMCHAIQSAEEMLPLLQKATVVVIGPGLGKSAWSRGLFDIISTALQPVVVDADALNLLAEQSDRIKKNDHWIVTPHAGEAGRLLRRSAEEVQANRLESAKNLADLLGGVVVLKGADTIVFSDDELPSVCPFGNPGMASAGMGDVLSGVIAGLLAQHFLPLSAAKAGVLLHALAGDEAAKIKGERGLLAMDLMPELHKLVNFRK